MIRENMPPPSNCWCGRALIGKPRACTTHGEGYWYSGGPELDPDTEERWKGLSRAEAILQVEHFSRAYRDAFDFGEKMKQERDEAREELEALRENMKLILADGIHAMISLSQRWIQDKDTHCAGS